MNRPAISLKILVAPLDWGLGHATRCIPLIRELLAQGCTVLLAADGAVKTLLEKEFPQLPVLPLPGYAIEYAASGWELPLKIVAQIPKLLAAIKKEEEWLKEITETEGLDAVISDNRYGLHYEKITSVFMTHQLLIKAPFRIAEDLLQELNYQYINRFDECWVPDAAGDNNLAGLLSHPANEPEIPLYYLGTLSRFTNNDGAQDGNGLLILLSGPEPQRTLLENIVLGDLKEYSQPVTLVRGLPQAEETPEVAANVTVFNHLPAAALEQKIREASLVISRCGYSTVMDLATLKKRSILIPTPGQTEQEYLAKHLLQKNFAFCVEQKKFSLKKALEMADAFQYQLNYTAENNLPIVVSSLLESIEAKKEATAD